MNSYPICRCLNDLGPPASACDIPFPADGIVRLGAEGPPCATFCQIASAVGCTAEQRECRLSGGAVSEVTLNLEVLPPGAGCPDAGH
jgi:hypothetical protein